MLKGGWRQDRMWSPSLDPRQPAAGLLARPAPPPPSPRPLSSRAKGTTSRCASVIDPCVAAAARPPYYRRSVALVPNSELEPAAVLQLGGREHLKHCSTPPALRDLVTNRPSSCNTRAHECVLRAPKATGLEHAATARPHSTSPWDSLRVVFLCGFDVGSSTARS